jgi:hypothetical protein
VIAGSEQVSGASAIIVVDAEEPKGKLSGAKVAFTGKMRTSWCAAGKRIRGLGGRYVSGASRSLDILVVGHGGGHFPAGSAKLDKVEHLNAGGASIAVVSEDIWEAMLESEHWRFGERVPGGNWSRAASCGAKGGFRMGLDTVEGCSRAIAWGDGSWTCRNGAGMGRCEDAYLAMLAAEDAMEGGG